MIVPSVTQPTVQQSSTQTPPNQTIDKNGFLQLLIAQLKNQDPLQPMDNQQFAVQLATFNSLEQLMDIDKQLTTLQTTQGQANQFNSASLIGKQIQADGNTVALQNGGSTTLGYRLSANATKVSLKIQDSNGTLVRQLDLGPQGSGDQAITWDGKDATGRAVPAGTYSFQVTASDATGKQVTVASRLSGIVKGVDFGGSEPVLDLGNVQVPLSSVTAVSSQQ